MPGSIDNDGNLRNSRGIPVGRIDSDGIIYDGKNIHKGRIESDGIIRTFINFQICGKVEANGIVRDGLFNMIGKIEDDGTIRNKSMIAIACIPNIPKTWAAAAFLCFDFDMS
jgi:hypothetical protein